MSEINDLIKKGCELSARGDHKQAHEAFVKVCSLAPESAPAWCNRGGTAFLSKNTQDAESSYQKALSLDPDNVEAHLGLARLFLLSNEWDSAIERLNGSEKIAEHPERDYMLGIAFENKGKPSKAAAHYLAAVDQGHDGANKSLQRMYVARNEPEKLAALVTSSPSPDLHLLTALLQALPSAKSRSVFFDECVKNYRESAEVYELTAGVHLHKKEFAYAARACRRAKENISGLNPLEWPSLKECAWF